MAAYRLRRAVRDVGRSVLRCFWSTMVLRSGIKVSVRRHKFRDHDERDVSRQYVFRAALVCCGLWVVEEKALGEELGLRCRRLCRNEFAIGPTDLCLHGVVLDWRPGQTNLQ